MDALPIDGGDRRCPTHRTVPARCTPAATTGTPRCCSAPRKYLAETRNFDGTAMVIFQPAEEGGGGGDEMVKDGLMERFGVQEVYGMHNMPGIPVGQFAIRPGPLMAAATASPSTIEGKGGHAARPHECVDTVLVGCQVVHALQSIVARNVDPLEAARGLGRDFQAGDAYNVIPQTATLAAPAARSSPTVRDLCEARVAGDRRDDRAAYGAAATVDYGRGYPVTVQPRREQTDFVADVAARGGAARARSTPTCRR